MLCLGHDLQVLLRSGLWFGGGLAVVWRGYGYIIAASFPRFVKLDHGVRAMEAVAGHYGRWQDAVTLCSYILEKDNIVPCFLQSIPVAMYFCLNITIYSIYRH